jgi:CRP-like cAMP-binding protein
MLNVKQPDLQRFLDRLLGRSVLSHEEQQAVLGLPTRTIQVGINRDFVGLDEVVDQVSLVVDGLVGRFDQNSLGARQITAFHIAGDMADLHSVVQPKATSALQALSTTTLLQVAHRDLRGIAARYPAIAEALWRDCIVDGAILAQWIVNVGRRDSKTRIAHLLCETAVR